MDLIKNQILNNPITKEEAREQFELKTKELGINHVYTFDEYWDMMEDYKKRLLFRNKITEIQNQMLESEGTLKGDELNEYNPVKSSFADGLYIREIFNPAGQLLVTKVHKKQHAYFLQKGDMSIITEDGIKRIKAPYNGITEPDTKRLIYTHEDCIFITVHATNLNNVEEIEKEVVSDNYENDLLENSFVKEILKELI
tara:strand:+ start:8178 stop:8771 length:594 start_codon:yes stop_codon:yes gene_type:complete